MDPSIQPTHDDASVLYQHSHVPPSAAVGSSDKQSVSWRRRRTKDADADDIPRDPKNGIQRLWSELVTLLSTHILGKKTHRTGAAQRST